MGHLLQVTVSEEDSRATVAVRGELDLSTVEELRDALAAARAPAREIVLDLSGLSFMDSSGINALIEADGAARSNGHSFRIAELSVPVARVLELSGAGASLVIARSCPRA